MPPRTATEEEKRDIDNNLENFPILYKLIKNNPKRYITLSNPFEKDISYRFPGRNSSRDQFRTDSSVCEIGYLLLHSEVNGTKQYLDLVESIFFRYPSIQNKYADKLCENFFRTLSEIKVYDRLCNAGFTPDIEFPITTPSSRHDEPSNSDFSIIYEGRRYFLEVKHRGAAYQDELAHSGLPARYPQTGFVNPETGECANQQYDQNKTENMIVDAIDRQISKWATSNYATVPVILMIEVSYDILGMSYNIDFNRVNRRVTIPPNFAGVFLFAFYPRERSYPEKIHWYPILRFPHRYSRCPLCTRSPRCRPHDLVPLSLYRRLEASFRDPSP
ncbi:hypothetical protein McpSp1_18080 [Methanocorpusculaceae archaeon Sp1]|nr:hypothetical protein [Methanocorpusculaceae archaeon Sp1]